MTAMTTERQARLSTHGNELDITPDCFGELRDSSAVQDDATELRERMRDDGYLFLRDYLHREAVLDARRAILELLAEHGRLDPDYPLMDGVPNPHPPDHPPFASNWPHHIAPLHALLYSGRMMDFYTRFLGGPVRHFDYTWLRVMSPGLSTPPHMDIVYMGRGTTNLHTSWTPLGDADFETGGLMLLEGSHRHEKLKANYGRKDVDTFCENRRDAGYEKMGGGGNIRVGGNLSLNPARLRERLGGRWLTAEFRAGDLIVFSMYTVHCGLDNHSHRLRLSSDSRYQLASEPADERWIGAEPIAHGPGGKRGMIC